MNPQETPSWLCPRGQPEFKNGGAELGWAKWKQWEACASLWLWKTQYCVSQSYCCLQNLSGKTLVFSLLWNHPLCAHICVVWLLSAHELHRWHAPGGDPARLWEKCAIPAVRSSSAAVFKLTSGLTARICRTQTVSALLAVCSPCETNVVPFTCKKNPALRPEFLEAPPSTDRLEMVSLPHRRDFTITQGEKIFFSTFKNEQSFTFLSEDTQTHTQSSRNYVSAQGCRANQSLGWAKAGGEVHGEGGGGYYALQQQRDGERRGGGRGIEPLLWQQWFYAMVSSLPETPTCWQESQVWVTERCHVAPGFRLSH